MIVAATILLLAPAVLAPPLQVTRPPRSGVVEMGPPTWFPGGGGRAGVGDNVRMNQDSGTMPQNETAAAVDPNDPLHVAGGANDYRLGDARGGWYVSFDGGASWTDGVFPLILNYDASGDPDLAFDSTGNLYYSLIIFQRDSNVPPSGVYVFKSTDGGLTWTGPVTVSVSSSSDFDDKPFMEADRTGSPYSGSVYVAWTKWRAFDGPVYFSRSTDGAASFATPRRIQDSSMGLGAMPVVGPNGELYVFWTDFDYTQIRMDRSFDGGATFGTDRAVAAIQEVYYPLPGFGFRGITLPYAAVDTSGGPYDGRIYVVWDDRRRASDNADIWMTYSDDQGTTWAAPYQVSEGPAGKVEFFPFVTADERGRVHVMHYTDKYTSGRLDVEVRRSNDGGLTWDPPVRVTSTSFDPRLDGFGGAFIGDYVHMADSPNDQYPMWCDTRLGNADVFAARIDTTMDLWPYSGPISNAAPQPMDLILDGGPSSAGRAYALLGSASGTDPGVTVGGVHVPLNPDRFTLITLNRANTPPLANFQGLLDARGRATATFAPPAGALAPVVGQDIYFAWVTHAGGVLDTASNATAIGVVP